MFYFSIITLVIMGVIYFGAVVKDILKHILLNKIKNKKR